MAALQKAGILIILSLLVAPVLTHAQETDAAGIVPEHITVASWNIEHLGTAGRGFGGGFGGGTLPRRTDSQLAEIGFFIRDTLKADLVALQEIAISYDDGNSRSAELDKICAVMGEHWLYALPPKRPDNTAGSMYTAFLWNSEKVHAVSISPFSHDNLVLADAELFDRAPLFGYFETQPGGTPGNDFLLINVHLASGKHNDENHLIALTLLEHSINRQLGNMSVGESDRIILGDFNDNPYEKKENGSAAYSPALYAHLGFKGYTDYVTPDFHATRMDNKLTSVIDHILVNSSAARHILQAGKAEIWLPPGGQTGYAEWRKTFSDHFPVYFFIAVSADDDSD